MESAAAGDQGIERAAQQLDAGLLVAFPTETVYGLGADAENPDAVAKIYEAKGRPADHPLIVHLAPEADLAYWAASVPADAHRLIEAFWPGPLTLIFKRAPGIPDAVTGGQDSIGLRCPAHPVAQALLRAFRHGRGGIAAPSANKFGHVSPTTAQHVRDEFGNEPLIAAILDGGQSDVGIESTILDFSRHVDGAPPALLRPGRITAEQIAEVIGQLPTAPSASAPRASGTLESHYAPGTPTMLITPDKFAATVCRLQESGKRVALLSWSALEISQAQQSSISHAVFHRHMPSDASAYAHDLYAALRKADQAHADLILVESPPDLPAWSGVLDRLRRATFASAGLLEQLFLEAT